MLIIVLAVISGWRQVSNGSQQLDRIDGLNGQIPQIGDAGLRVLTPKILELCRINSQPKAGVPDSWNFVSNTGFAAPLPGSLVVEVDGQTVAASIIGFQRRVAYAPLKARDLRIHNRVFIELSSPAELHSEILVRTTGWETPGQETTYHAQLSAERSNPALHVNQEGYATAAAKQAVIGYYLGSAGELTIPSSNYQIIDIKSGQSVFTGILTPRPDLDFATTPIPYQKVMLADFTDFQTPGHYALQIEGMGRSMHFRISDDMILHFARTIANGLYNQRCGCPVELPFSRHTHAACHTARAEIPDGSAEYQNTWQVIAAANGNAPSSNRMISAETQLYPIVKTGSIDVSGGHHDAGDYSKYTINSAQLIHHLVFSADNFAGAGALDNLGIPESGDGKSDLLQQADWEAAFLAKMQEDDGGFFFLVYPKNRKYENDVLPDQGDPQVVWPKNTAVTAAAVGALADIGSSPRFREEFPEKAA